MTTYRFSFSIALIVAAVAAAAVWIAIADPAAEWALRLLPLAVGLLAGVSIAIYVLRIEDRRRDDAFAALRDEDSRAEQARVRAEFPAELADRVADGNLTIEEARKHHRAGQLGPNDEWVP